MSHLRRNLSLASAFVLGSVLVVGCGDEGASQVAPPPVAPAPAPAGADAKAPAPKVTEAPGSGGTSTVTESSSGGAVKDSTLP